MNTDLTNPMNTSLTVEEAWGSEGTSRQDILVPRLQLMHDISQNVKDGKAEAGDIIHSITGEVLASDGQTVEIIPFTTFREWHINEVDERGRDKFKEKILMTSENENWPLEGVENGKPIRRVRTINYFVMLPQYINELPFLVTFKKSSIMAGKKLSTHFQQCAMKKQPPAVQTYLLFSVDRSWDGFTFKTLDVSPKRPTTPEELEVAKKWYITLKQSEVKIDGADEFNPDMYEG